MSDSCIFLGYRLEQATSRLELELDYRALPANTFPDPTYTFNYDMVSSR